MEIAAERHGGHAQLVVVEVVTRGEIDVPSLGDAQVAREVHRVGEFVGIAHALHVDLGRGVFPHGHAVAHGKAPW